MPNLATHIDLAQQAAGRLQHPTIEANVGHFLLGSTTPDVRAISRGSREDYHFAPLDFDEVGAGVSGLFNAYPGLRDVGEHNGQTVAFVAGYMTHLIADEVWIQDMYRPYFGNDNAFADATTANVMDRAVQLDLDRRVWHAFDAARGSLHGATEKVEIGFIDRDILDEWLGWVFTVGDRGFSWDRLRFMAKRVSRGDASHPAHRIAEEFLAGMPDSLEALYLLVPSEDVDRYRERTVDALVREVDRFLS